MKNLQDGWYAKKEFVDDNGEHHTETSEYMSKEKAKKYCNKYNKSHDISEGSAYLIYDSDFDIE